MTEKLQVITCKRCGRGFILTRTYRDMLRRRGAKIVEPVSCPTCFVRKGPRVKQEGTVKWFSSRKRYGFLVAGDGEEVFFHEEQVLNGKKWTPEEGQVVRFHTRREEKGLEALNVERSKGS